MQRAALDALVALILDYPVLSAVFREQGAEAYIVNIQVDQQYCTNGSRDLLLPSARRALICVKNVELNKLVCTMHQMMRQNHKEGKRDARELVHFVR